MGFDNQLIKGHLTQDDYISSEKWFNDTKNHIFGVQGIKLLALNINAEPGVSGGAVLNDQDAVIGIFSGSFHKGAGFAWAIPISYADTSKMTPIGKAAARITIWPKSVFLRSGFEFERSLQQNSDISRASYEIRQEIKAYQEKWINMVRSSMKVHEFVRLFNPIFDNAKKTLTVKNADSINDVIFTSLQSVMPAYDQLGKAGKELQDTVASLKMKCFSYQSLGEVFSKRLPATRKNLIESHVLARTLGDITDSLRHPCQSIQELQSIMQSIVIATAKLSDPKLSKYESAKVGLSYSDGLNKMADLLLSNEVAMAISSEIRVYTKYAELIERYEIFDWDSESQVSSFDFQNDFSITLKDGWLSWDKELSDVILARGKAPLNVSLVNFGDDVENIIPLGAGQIGWVSEVKWEGIQDSTSLSRLWAFTDAGIRAVELRENGMVSNTKRSLEKGDGKLILSITGKLMLNENPKKIQDVFIYNVFSKFGTAIFAMYLFSGQGNASSIKEMVHSIVIKPPVQKPLVVTPVDLQVFYDDPKEVKHGYSIEGEGVCYGIAYSETGPNEVFPLTGHRIPKRRRRRA